MGMFQKTDPPTGEPSRAFTLDQMEQLREIIGLVKSSNPEASDKSELALQLLKDMNETYGRVVPKANAEGNGLSPFTVLDGCPACIAGDKHGDGRYQHDKPKMRYESYICGVRMREDMMTIAEVELLNQFENNREARNGQWTAILDRKGTRPRLLIQFPATDIMQMDSIPPLTLLLKALLHGEKSIDPDNLLAEIKALRDKVSKLEMAAA